MGFDRRFNRELVKDRQHSGRRGIVAIGVSFAIMKRCGLAIVAFLTGCSLPSQEADFHSIDPQERARALASAAATSDRSHIPDLIEMLSSDDPATRMLAIRSLERMTGQTLDYDYAAEPPVREAGIDRWEEWLLNQAATQSPEPVAAGTGANSG